MPTDVISTIGATSSPVTPDYSTLQAWMDDCPANLVSDDKRYIGECLDQGEFEAVDVVLSIGGVTTDSTRYIVLKCAAGASFNDKVGTRSTALFYNASNGVALRAHDGYNDTTIYLGVPYTQLIGLQISGRFAVRLTSTSANSTLTDSCIIQGYDNGGDKGAWYSESVTSGHFIINSLILNVGAGSGIGIWNSNTIIGCTIVAPGGGNWYGVHNLYGSPTTTLKNCAIFGFGGMTAVMLATNVSYNATDDPSPIGTNNLRSLTFADQFVDEDTDFRAVDTGGLRAGIPDRTYTSVDISGLTRDTATISIGAWEILPWVLRVQDTFTDTFSTPMSSHTPDIGGAWDADSECTIGIHNKADISSGSVITVTAFNATVVTDRQAVEATYVASSDIAYLYLRSNGNRASPNGYVLEIKGNPFNTYAIYRIDAGSATTLTSGSQSINTNDVARFEADGSVLTFILNGSFIDNTTDTTYPSGQIGFAMRGSFVEIWDNFNAYDDAITGRNNGYPGAIQPQGNYPGALQPTSVSISLSYEQEGYRWRNDDGDEDGATWLATQDTTITQPILTNTRIRFLIDIIGDAPSQALKLQYRKVGDSVWRTIGTI